MPLHATEPFVYNRAGSWKHAALIADVSALVVATPGAVLFDEEFNLGPWGCVAHTQRHILPTVSIQKPDGEGGWIATTGYLAGAPPWITATDPVGYEVEFSFTTIMATPNGETVPPSVNGGTIEVGSDTGGDVDSYYEDRYSRIRLVAKRTSRIYTPEEQAVIDAYGYRARITLLTSDLVLWEREFPIEVASSSQFLLNETVDLAEFGLTAGIDRALVVAEFRRNGRTIRTRLSREYQIGEAFDHPAPPVHFDIRNVSPYLPPWNNQNGGGDVLRTYYGNNQPLDGVTSEVGACFQAGVLHNEEFGDCGEAIMQHLQITAWRSGDLPTEYWDGTRTGVVSLDLSSVTVGLEGTVFCSALDTQVSVTFVGDGNAPQYNGTTYGGGTWSELDPGGGVIVHFTPGSSTMATALATLLPETTYEPYSGLFCPGFSQTKVRLAGSIPGTAFSYVLVAGDAFGPVTINGGSLVAVPVVPASFEGCTVRVRLLAAPQHRSGEYPFDSLYSSDLKPMNIKLRQMTRPADWPAGLASCAQDGRLYFDGKRVTTDDLNLTRDAIYLRAPNGTVYTVTVANDGVITTSGG